MERIGEVVEASTLGFTAQCYELHNPPPLGDLVKVREGEVEIYGVVYNAATTPLDPGRLPLACGEGADSEEEVFRRHPQLFRLLRTQFQATVIAYRRGGRVFYHLPPRPPRIHSFVYPCPEDEAAEVGKRFDFLNLLLEAGFPWRDEVIIACLRRLGEIQNNGQEFLAAAGRELALRLAGQGHRLNLLLRRLFE